MATRALAAGRRVAGRSWFPALASSTRRDGVGGGALSHSPSRRDAHTQAGERDATDHGSASAETVTAEQVEAALNSKNVEEVAQDLGARVATTVLPLPEEVTHDADAAWVPDQDTGVFVPAEEAAAGNGASDEAAETNTTAASVLDQTVFNREEEMEDVERPAVDMMANGGD